MIIKKRCKNKIFVLPIKTHFFIIIKDKHFYLPSNRQKQNKTFKKQPDKTWQSAFLKKTLQNIQRKYLSVAKVIT